MKHVSKDTLETDSSTWRKPLITDYTWHVNNDKDIQWYDSALIGLTTCVNQVFFIYEIDKLTGTK